MRVPVIGLVLLLVPAWLQGQDTIRLPIAGYRGQVVCVEGKPDVRIRPGMAPLIRDAVLAHERVHVEQMQRYPSCEAADSAIRSSPDSIIAFEAEAYCASLHVLADAGRDPRDYWGEYLRAVFYEVHAVAKAREAWDRSIGAILLGFKRACPDLLGAPES